MGKATHKGVAAGDIAEVIRRRMDPTNSLLHCTLSSKNFHREFPTAEEREAFRKLYPDMWWTIWGFRNLPELFSRRDFFELIKQQPPRFAFEPPDVRAVGYSAIRQARADWWVKNKLPLNDAERAWLEEQAQTTESEERQ